MKDDVNSEKIEIISTEDEKIKTIGEILSNNTSRTILRVLGDGELSANEIAEKIGMLLSLTIYHLKKMQSCGIIRVSKINKSEKGLHMNYYTVTKYAFVILSAHSYEKIEKANSLGDLLKRVSRFVTIGIIAIIAWFAMSYDDLYGLHPPVMTPLEEVLSQPTYWNIIVPLIIIIIGLVTERILKCYNR